MRNLLIEHSNGLLTPYSPVLFCYTNFLYSYSAVYSFCYTETYVYLTNKV